MIRGDRQPLQKRLKGLKHEASTWIPSWKDLATYVAPTRGFFEDLPNQGKEIDHQILLDDEAGKALGILAAGLSSGMTNRALPWFKYGFPDKALMRRAAVAQWCDDVRDQMLSVYDRSNVYGWLYNIYEELGGFGTASGIMLNDFRTVVRGRNFTIGEYFLGVDAQGRVNTFGRFFFMTVCQLVEQFGLENVSETVKTRYLNTSDKDSWVKVCHLVSPNPGRNPDKEDYLNMSWRSDYWEDGSPDGTFLQRSGFRSFRVMAPRWSLTTTMQVYGHSPGWRVLGDSKQLQKMQLDKLIMLDKVADPPVQADGSVDVVNTLPGGVSRTSGLLKDAGVRTAYQINPDFQAMLLNIEQTKSDIREGLYADLFKQIIELGDGKRTATEVISRNEEKLAQLGPLIEVIKSELLDPLNDITFNRLLEVGAIPPPPPEIEGMTLTPEYISLLAQAQKSFAVAPIEATLATVGNIAATQPEVVDNIDMDAAVEEIAAARGAPARIIRDRDQVAAIRKSRAQEKARQEAIQVTPEIVKGAQVLSDTQLGKGSALDAIAGT
jgi:hypothetical protein